MRVHNSKECPNCGMSNEPIGGKKVIRCSILCRQCLLDPTYYARIKEEGRRLRNEGSLKEKEGCGDEDC